MSDNERQWSDNGATMKRQWSDNGATMERQWSDNGATTSDNGATMERQWSDNGRFPAARAQKDTVTMVEGRVAVERDTVLQFAVFVFSSNVFRCGSLRLCFVLFEIWCGLLVSMCLLICGADCPAFVLF